MGAASARPHLRGLILVLGVLFVAGLAVVSVTGAAPSALSEAGETPAIGSTYEPEILGIPYGIYMPPAWEQTSTYGYNSDVVATAPRTLYTTGSRRTGTSVDLHLAKYVDGTLAWERLYDGPAQGTDVGAAIAARGAAIYTAGYRTTLRGDRDLLLVRWDSAGKRIWVRAYDSGSRMDDWATDVAVDADGNVTVIGVSYKPTTGHDWVVVSYKPDGTRRYVQRYDGPSHLDDQPAKMLIDSAGSIYVAGRSYSAKSGSDALVAKYSKTGTRLWTRRHNGTANDWDAAKSLRARPGGGVYVAGDTVSLDTGYDGLLLAYTAAGTRLFAAHDCGDTEPMGQTFNDLEVLPGGDIICGGLEWSPETTSDRFYAIYSSTGELLERVSEYGEGHEQITHMAKDGQGGVYLTGDVTSDFGITIFTERIRAGGTNWRSDWPGMFVLRGSDAEQLSQPLFSPAAIATKGVNAYIVGTSQDGSTVVLGYVY
jgi:hypothetical protein